MIQAKIYTNDEQKLSADWLPLVFQQIELSLPNILHAHQFYRPPAQLEKVHKTQHLNSKYYPHIQMNKQRTSLDVLAQNIDDMLCTEN